jgi:hypothetical protein
MRRFWPLVLALVAAAVLAVPAFADVVGLQWKETAKRQGHAQLTFAIKSIEFKNGGWTVTATFTNVTKTTVNIGREYGLLLLRTQGVTAAELRQGQAYVASSYGTSLPKALGPGKSWSGTFSGTGTPPTGVYVRVIFGRFTGGFAGKNGFYWITDHAYKFSLLPSQTA